MYSPKKRLLVIVVCTLPILISFFHNEENIFFLSRMIEQPGRVGSVAPSSKSLADCMVQEALSVIKQSNDVVVEIGPGTGCITRVLLEQGVAAERLICVEADPALHKYMTEHFPSVQTILGDAAELATILPEHYGEVSVVISGVPLKNLPLDKEKEIIQACCSVLRSSGKLIQFTYGVRPPSVAPGLFRQFVGFIFLNLPPAFVWSFTKV